MLTALRSVATLRRTVLVAALCAFTALSSPTLLFGADEPAQTGGAAEAAPANAPAMPCKDSVNGECCAACQEKKAENKAADQAPADCPCKRAKQAQQGS